MSSVASASPSTAPAGGSSAAPRGHLLAIGLVAGATLALELLLTRLFSVLFLYHYSFYAVSLVMAGLTFGGLIAGRRDLAAMSDGDHARMVARACRGMALGQLLGLGFLCVLPASDVATRPSLLMVSAAALIFLPAFTCAGVAVAGLLARRPEHGARLYAADLACAAAACALFIPLSRLVQGPAAILATTLAAMIAEACVRGSVAPRPAPSRTPVGLQLLALLALGGLAANLWMGPRALGLRLGGEPGKPVVEPVLERWNEHSRVQVWDDAQAFFVLIDKSAGTFTPKIGRRAEGAPVPVQPWWDSFVFSLGYRLGRPLNDVAIIGVGGGRDLLGPLANGARHVDGFEINRSIVELLERDLVEFNDVAKWPEVTLHASEGRTGLRHSGRDYDVIQASLIDTWAATASGGFVLSENGLYTREAWNLFLSRLTDGGLLTMTRWFVPAKPTEAHRLVALASRALEDRGVERPAEHVVLVTDRTREQLRESPDSPAVATILVSTRPFSAEEVERIGSLCEASEWMPILGPGVESLDPLLPVLLDPARRDAAVAEHPDDISPPTDERPYFFLQLRPSSWLGGLDRDADILEELTFNALRVILLLALFSLAFAGCVLAFGVGPRAGELAERDPARRRLARALAAWFACIGAGYMFVQIGLHQRLILALGSPTMALSVLLASMLLGGGVGSWISGRMSVPRATLVAATIAPAWLLALTFFAPSAELLGGVADTTARALVAGAISGATGVALGLGFPAGWRIAGRLGGAVPQRLWAINGATGIAGSACAALAGPLVGHRGTMLVGLILYLGMACSARMALRAWTPLPAEETEASSGS